jgi:medium-chain acyl-[acyl-carrier-protein] hydrolase
LADRDDARPLTTAPGTSPGVARLMMTRAVRLLCVPYAGGRASVFWDWRDALPSSVDVRGIELPGHGRRRQEPLRLDVAAMVDDIVSHGRPLFDRPIALFGHSMGATIAFELARRLGAAGVPPVRLYVSGRRAPHLPDPQPPTFDRPDPEVLAHLRRLNGTPPFVFESPDLLRLMLPILRADFQVSQTYAYRAGYQLACPVVAFGGVDDPEVRPSVLEPWCEHTSGPFRLHTLPGDHFFLHTSQAALLSVLAADLQDAVEALAEPRRLPDGRPDPARW